VVISERIRQFPGVELQNAYVRNYPIGRLPPHPRYTGLITQQELPSYQSRLLATSRSANPARAAYDSTCATPGQTEVEVDAFGNRSGRGDLHDRRVQVTSADLDRHSVQEALEKELSERVRASGTATVPRVAMTQHRQILRWPRIRPSTPTRSSSTPPRTTR